MEKVLCIECPPWDEKPAEWKHSEYTSLFHTFLEHHQGNDTLSPETLRQEFMNHYGKTLETSPGLEKTVTVGLEDYQENEFSMPISFFVHQFGYEVEKAYGSAEAMTKLRAGEHYHVIVADMRNMDEAPSTLTDMLRSLTELPIIIAEPYDRGVEGYIDTLLIPSFIQDQKFVNSLYDALLQYTEKPQQQIISPLPQKPAENRPLKIPGWAMIGMVATVALLLGAVYYSGVHEKWPQPPVSTEIHAR